jgi:peptide/nickel transport system substrate-binding protein
MVVDREALVAQTMGREALLAETTILPGNWAYAPDAHLPAYDPSAATQLLDEAGWVIADGTLRQQGETQLAFTLLVADQGEGREIGQTLVQAWQQIGIGAQLRVVDGATFRSEVLQSDPAQRTYDAALIEFSQEGLADPDPYPFWSQAQIEGGQNYSGFYDREISEMLEIARRDPNGVRRADLYRTFQHRFGEAVPAILLYYPTYHYAVSCQVAGVQIAALRSPSDRFRTIADWRLASGAELDALCHTP